MAAPLFCCGVRLIASKPREGTTSENPNPLSKHPNKLATSSTFSDPKSQITDINQSIIYK